MRPPSRRWDYQFAFSSAKGPHSRRLCSLPDAQLDRFIFNVQVDSPAGFAPEKCELKTVLDARKIIALQNAVRDLPVGDHVVRYAIRLVSATRPADPSAPGFIKHNIHTGAGPRAAQFLVLGAKARAVIEGRMLVTTDDVRSVARPVLRHRIVANSAADRAGLKADRIVRELVLAVPEPEDGEPE